MSKPLGRIRSVFAERFGELLQSKDFRRFFTTHTGLLLFTNFSGVFLNTFFIKASGSVSASMVFNLFAVIASALFIQLSAPLCRLASPRLVMLMGIIAYNLEYAIVFLLGNASSRYIIPLGLLHGIAGANYWLGYSNMLTDTTVDTNRDRALSLIGIGLSLITLVIPSLSGAIISAFPGFGYLIVFGLSFIISVLTMLSVFRVKSHRANDKTYHLLRAAKLAFRDTRLLFSLSTKFVRGLREGMFLFIIPMLIFYLQSSEALVGLSTFFAGIASIVSYVIIGKVMAPRTRVSCMFLGATILIGAALPMVFAPSMIWVMIFNFLNALFVQFVIAPTSGFFYGAVQEVPGAFEQRQELFAIKEIFLSAGRIISILSVLLIPVNLSYFAIAIAVMTAAQYIGVLLGRLTQRRLDVVGGNP